MRTDIFAVKGGPGGDVQGVARNAVINDGDLRGGAAVVLLVHAGPCAGERKLPDGAVATRQNAIVCQIVVAFIVPAERQIGEGIRAVAGANILAAKSTNAANGYGVTGFLARQF